MHRHLGHLSFFVLRSMLPFIFSKEFVVLFKCLNAIYVNLKSIIMPHILRVIQKVFTLLIWFILTFGGLHRTLVYLVFDSLSLLLMTIPMLYGFSSWKKNLWFLPYKRSQSNVYVLICGYTKKNSHLLGMAQTLPNALNLIGEAIIIVVYHINRLPSRILDGLSPIEFMSSFFPSIPFLSSFHS